MVARISRLSKIRTNMVNGGEMLQSRKGMVLLSRQRMRLSPNICFFYDTHHHPPVIQISSFGLDQFWQQATIIHESKILIKDKNESRTYVTIFVFRSKGDFLSNTYISYIRYSIFVLRSCHMTYMHIYLQSRAKYRESPK